MSFVIVLAATAAFCLLFKGAIRKVPAFLYAVALLLSALYALTSYMVLPFWLQQLLFLLMQKGTLATALFVVVMYMGVFKDNDMVKHRLLPIRATLSIVASMLILGHVAKYLIAYGPRFLALDALVQCGLVLGIACLALMIPLAVTSFNTVKRRMAPARWVSLQKAAYVFYGLVYVHLAALLVPSSMGAAAAAAGDTAGVSLAAYTIVFGLYAVLRVSRAARSRQAAREPAHDSAAGAPEGEKAPLPS